MNSESQLIQVQEISILVAPEGDLLVVSEENTTIFGIGIQGPAGIDGAVSQTISKLASQNLSGHRVVYQDGAATVNYVDNQNLAHSQLVLGITKNAVNSGASVDVQFSGEMTEPSWNWVIGELVFCGANGVLTQTPNTSGFLQRVGIAIAPTVLKVEIEEPIYL